MRFRVILLALLVLLSQSGCTLVFGLAGATHNGERLEGPVPDAVLKPYTPVVVETNDGRRRSGYWQGRQRVGADSTSVVVLDRRPNGMQQYPAETVAAIYKTRPGLNRKGLGIGLAIGGALDLLILGGLAYAIYNCEVTGCLGN